MRLSNISFKSIVLQILAVVAITVSFVYFTNLTALNYINSDNTYAQLYQSKLEKGYLTEQDSKDLDKSEQEYRDNEKARRSERSAYFQMFLIGMALYSLAIYIVRSKKWLFYNQWVLVSVSGISALLISSSLKQCLIWSVFFYIGYSVANLSSKSLK